MKRLSIALLCQLSALGVLAQALDSVRPLLDKVQQAYQHAAYLSYKVKYLYANEGSPNEPNDSVLGVFQLDKGRCHLIMDGTETLIDGQHTIQVSEGDRIIYVSKAGRPGMLDPKSIMDSIYGHLKGSDIQVSEEGKNEVLSITVPPGQTYKRMDMAVDRQTGFIARITYYIHTQGFVGKDLIRSAGHDGPYEQEGRVQIVFSDYRLGNFGESVFNEDKFIARVAGKYQPAGQYKGYQLFLASPNL